jgi:hypothetical protein
MPEEKSAIQKHDISEGYKYRKLAKELVVMQKTQHHGYLEA